MLQVEIVQVQVQIIHVAMQAYSWRGTDVQLLMNTKALLFLRHYFLRHMISKAFLQCMTLQVLLLPENKWHIFRELRAFTTSAYTRTDRWPANHKFSEFLSKERKSNFLQVASLFEQIDVCFNHFWSWSRDKTKEIQRNLHIVHVPLGRKTWTTAVRHSSSSSIASSWHPFWSKDQ